MAEQILDQVRDLAEGQIDFEGQKVVEFLATALLCLVGAISFAVGYFLQDIALALKVGLAGTALAFLVVVPPWPFFKRQPLKWLPPGGGSAPTANTQQNIVIDEKMFAQQ